MHFLKFCLVIFLFNQQNCFAQNPSMEALQLDSIFQQYFKAGEPGAAVLIAREGKIIYKKGFGLSDLTTKENINTQTLFNIGSISKTFVSYGILKLVSEGRLGLQDPIIKYFQDFKSREIANEVKLVHLLTHSSGLPDSRKIKDQRDFYLTARDEENFEPLKGTKTLEFEPGSRYKYSNPAFNGLALIIEKTSGMKWQDYIKKNIFQPAGMVNSTITDGPHPETGVSHGYIRNKRGLFEELDYGEEPTFAAAGNGGVWSSVEELWKYEEAIQNNKFLSKDIISLSRKVFPLPEWNDSLPSRLGLSWFVTNAGQEMIGHTGSQGGFISDYCWLPDKQVFYVLLCNIPVPLGEIRQKVYNTLHL